MHILATTVATLEEAETAVDLDQSPAEIVVLSFSDSDLSAFAEAWRKDEADLPTLRLASLKRLKHPMSVDLYIDAVAAHAKAIVVRALGGLDYWRYGFERLARLARDKGILLAALPGDDRPDPRLAELSTLAIEDLARIDALLREGGARNAGEALKLVGERIGYPLQWHEAERIGAAVGVDADGSSMAIDALVERRCDRPIALVVLYRASLLAADIAPVTALMRALQSEGLDCVSVAVTSLKDPAACAALERVIARFKPAVVLNATAFSALRGDGTSVLDLADAPVLQVVQSQSTREAWVQSSRGLSPTDLAMNVVLPELDGRLLAGVISFKDEATRDPLLEFTPVRHVPHSSRIGHVAGVAAAWARLRTSRPSQRRVAIVLSDYPARGGRQGYAVGLDTAASVERIAELLAAEGYDLGGATCEKGEVEELLRGSAAALMVPLADYTSTLAGLPERLQRSLLEAWGPPDRDPAVARGAFQFPVLRLGNILVALQPDRGSKVDRKSGYHDTSLPPRHAYVAFYAWLRNKERIDALVHLGTHGTLEWLPGKALALSKDCWPDAVIGTLPVVYPFIVNNPGEAMQAKRRLGAVTIGHLTPPLSAAGLHGALAELEGLVEEYSEADGLDKRRLALLEKEIVDRAWATGLARDCGLEPGMLGREAIAKLDAQLCDIKDLAVRDRLHVFGEEPDAEAAASLARAIAAAAGEPEMQARVGVKIAHSAGEERRALVAALDGRRIAAGPAGAPSRGRADVLPTGRNLTAIDPRAIPTRTAAVIGARAADEVIRRYLQDHGEYPRALVIDLWASASLRTGGDDLAQAMSYLGVRPVWDAQSGRVGSVEVLPLAALGRPRIDVTLRISGLFRDLFEDQIALFDVAVRAVASRDEDDADNPLAAARRRGDGLARIFGSAPGTYGAGAASLALDEVWGERGDLGRAYLDAATFAYGVEARDGCQDAGEFGRRVRAADALVHSRDDRERDILDGEETADFIGGFAAAAELLGSNPALLHVDTSLPEAPKARTAQEEVARVVRGRLANPQWVSAMLAIGHRGVAEIAQGVDALYAFAATSGAAPSHLIETVHDALLADETVLKAMADRNPDALASIVERLDDARRRGLWMTRRNAVLDELQRASLTVAGRMAAEPQEAAQ